MVRLKVVLNHFINYLLSMELKIQIIVFFLLTGKTTKIYRDAFSDLLDKIGELNLTFTPRII